ncbi:Nucleoid occlusion protein [subsurface metagenome]
MGKGKLKKYTEVLLTKIDPPNEFDRLEILPEKIDELAESIKEIGLLSPVLLSVSGERYEIVFGHRRFIACRQLGLDKITAQVVSYTKQQISVARATENLQREDLTPIEEGYTYSRLINELEMPISEVSKKTGKGAGQVKRRIDLLRMPESFKRALQARKISIGVAEELWSCADEEHREYLLEMAVEHGITVAVARQWVFDHRKTQRKAPENIGKGGDGSVIDFNEKIYRSCDSCQGPVELCDLKEIRVCPGCFEIIKEAMNRE